MEIHAPSGRLDSWKDVARHLAIITVGVLLALALEGVVSWIDHRMLVNEAAENLRLEIERNKGELDGLFANLDAERTQLEHADEIAASLLGGKLPEGSSLRLEYNDAELKNAAVTTGEITGAFGFMAYDDVRHYADVYDLQARFMRLQERQAEQFLDVYAFVRRIGADDPPGADAIARWRSQLDVALAGVLVREQVGHQLQARYEELLAKE